MNAKNVAAQFAAYTWLKECTTRGGSDHAEALRFARVNWRAFQSSTTEGLGRLLIQIAGTRQAKELSNAERRPRGQSRRKLALGAAG
jgi:hypothetical protein